ncbi:hypothetical protein AB0B78_29710 [Streptomyces sp. NPDC040724]|uniref:hypothetical protein n=1 Tax=Streptomyces sp. NPDC040724 TaxID=3155612 RepID=UPI0033D0B31E
MQRPVIAPGRSPTDKYTEQHGANLLVTARDRHRIAAYRLVRRSCSSSAPAACASTLLAGAPRRSMKNRLRRARAGAAAPRWC